jgi:pimeloyl-ACP methyl ester carboxylesterase
VPSPAQLAAAEAQYKAGLAADAVGNPIAIDHYFAVAAATWPCHLANVAAPHDRGNELYRSSVELLVAAASRHCRLHPSQGILLTSGQVIPITYRGFVWSPADFRAFVPVGTYSTPHLTTRYVAAGVGVPYVILTDNALGRPFVRSGRPFAATAVLAPGSFSSPFGSTFTLELYDPLRTCTTDAGHPLARDLTAPIAYAASLERDAWLVDFLRPGVDEANEGLSMLEPFQPGKIPVVFVHGLASDPITWAQLGNDLRAQPAIVERYQFWFFRYDTGKPFLSSASLLRRNLAEIRQVYDPLRCDPSLSRSVLVGHSMGGLIAKLQVTASGDQLWQAAATRPLSTIYTDPNTRADLTRAFYFMPSPDITRVIFIATPHRGSVDAARCVGRLSSALVSDPPEWRARHAQLVRDNPGAFRAELDRGIPTSVDLLEPSSQILQATQRLCFRPDVALHSIIGDFEWSPIGGRSDGVVAVSSARLLGVRSELFVDAEHTRIQQRPETAREVICILRVHAAAAESFVPPIASEF